MITLEPAGQNKIYDGQEKQFVFLDYLIIAAALFNAALAFLNANFFGVSATHVILAELIILSAAIGYVLRFGKHPPYNWLLYLGFTSINYLFISFISHTPNIKSFRDLLIMHSFTLAGFCYPKRAPTRMITLLTVIVLFFMLLEGAFTDFYLNLFNIGLYYFKTRGIGEAETVLTEGPSIFKNAAGFQGRFSWGLFNTHRLSSIFLEQTSLANFGMILAIFTSAFSEKLRAGTILFFIMSVFFILAGTDSRAALSCCGIIFILHFLTPYLPRYWHALLTPLLLLCLFVFFYDPHIFTMSDTIKGRLGWTAHLLANLTLLDWLGFNQEKLIYTADSGITYLFLSHGLIGFIVFWFVSAFSVPQNKLEARRFITGFTIYFYGNILVGASVLSIKTAALLWFLFGSVYKNALFGTAQDETVNRSSLK